MDDGGRVYQKKDEPLGSLFKLLFVSKNIWLDYRNTKMKKRRRLWGNISLLIIGTALITVGITIFINFEAIYEAILNKALSFNPTSKPFTVWQKNDPPLNMDIYLFNWTNPEDIRNSSTKPILKEVGPYRFKEVKEKVNYTWNDNNTISYMHRKTYYFDAENSVRNLSDIITTINAVPLTISYKARNFGWWAKRSVSFGLNTISSLYVTKTAGEILFDGYEESILTLLSAVPMLDVKDKFGIFYGKNGTIGTDGTFTMSTANDQNFGRLLSWNFRNQTDYYEGHCNDVKGSASEFYPINQKRDQLELYSSELCKYAILEYESDVTIKGVTGYKYTAKNMFDNGTMKPENRCFCLGDCLPSGVLNVSACRENSPTFLSMPHFFGGDPYYENSVEGVKADVDKHEFYIILEPKSGIVMDIAARMQLNMLLQPVDYITLYADVPKIVFPIFYFDQKIELKDELASSLRLIQNLPEYANYLELILISLGIIMILWSICSFFWCSRRITYKKDKCNSKPYEEVPLSEKQ